MVVSRGANKIVDEHTQELYPEYGFNKGYLEYDIWDFRYYIGRQDGERDASSSKSGYYPDGERWYSNRYDSKRCKKLFDHGSFKYWRPPYSDGSVGTIKTQAVQNLYQSILPKAEDSVTAKVVTRVKSTGALVENPEMTKVITQQLREVITQEKLKFFDTIMRAVDEYLSYGNAVVVIDEDSAGEYLLRVLPFHLTYFGEDTRGDIVWVYFETESKHFYGRKSVKELYFKDESGLWVKREEHTVCGEIVVENTKTYSTGFLPVHVAREGRFECTPYGFGSGMVALPHIKVLNWASNEAMYATQKAVSPTLLVDDAVNFATEGYGDDVLLTTPGAVVSIGFQSKPDGSPMLRSEEPVKTLSMPAPDFAFIQQQMVKEKEHVQSVFFVDPLFTAGETGRLTSRTATEVLQRSEQAVILYRGKASVLKKQLLTPLMRTLFENTLKLNRIKLDKNSTVNITYFSADSQRSARISMETLERVIAFKKQITGETDEDLLEQYEEEAREDSV